MGYYGAIFALNAQNIDDVKREHMQDVATCGGKGIAHEIEESGGLEYHSSAITRLPITRASFDAAAKQKHGGFVAYVWRDGPDGVALKRYRRWERTQAKRKKKLHALRASLRNTGGEDTRAKYALGRLQRLSKKRGPRPPAVMLVSFAGHD